MRHPADMARELAKIRDAVSGAVRHFDAEAEMNAALHLATEVRPAPLAVAVKTARDDLDRLIRELSEEPEVS